MLGILEKESKENEQKEFNHRNNMGKIPRISRHELTIERPTK